MLKIIPGKLIRMIEAEDIILAAIVIFMSFLPGKNPVDIFLKSSGVLSWCKLAGFIVISSGLWFNLATKSAISLPDGSIIDADKTLLRHFAYLSQITAIPLMILLLSNGDTGVIFIWWFIFAFISVIFWVTSFRKNAKKISAKTRRYAMILFTAVSSWYCTEHLINSYLLDAGHTHFILEKISEKSLTGFLNIFIEYTVFLTLFILPYTAMVVFPRFAAGNYENIRTWLARYFLFSASVIISVFISIL